MTSATIYSAVEAATIEATLMAATIAINSGRKADAVAHINAAAAAYKKLPPSFKPDAKAMFDGFCLAHATFIQECRAK